MAIGTAVDLNSKINGKHIVPVADQTEWRVLCSAPTVTDTITTPLAISRAEQHWGNLNHAGTSILVCLRYQIGQAVATPPVVRMIGKTAGQVAGTTAVPQRLADANGNYDLTFAADVNNDVQDGTYAYTAAQEVDCQNLAAVLAAIKTALIGGGTGAAIMGRVK